MWRKSDTWEPQSQLLLDVPELVGAYCKCKKLQVPVAFREQVAAAMAVEEAAATEEAMQERLWPRLGLQLACVDCVCWRLARL